MRWQLGDAVGLDAWLTANRLSAVRVAIAFNETTTYVTYPDKSLPTRHVTITYGAVNNDRRVIAVEAVDVPAPEVVDVESANTPPAIHD